MPSSSREDSAHSMIQAESWRLVAYCGCLLLRRTSGQNSSKDRAEDHSPSHQELRVESIDLVS